jgi:hypothetical protein
MSCDYRGSNVQQLQDVVRQFVETRQARWQYLEYMTVDNWIDYDEETSAQWDAYDKLRMLQEILPDRAGIHRDSVFGTRDLRGGFLGGAPSEGAMESSFPWVQTWPTEAEYFAKNIFTGMQYPVRKVGNLEEPVEETRQARWQYLEHMTVDNWTSTKRLLPNGTSMNSMIDLFSRLTDFAGVTALNTRGQKPGQRRHTIG